MEAIYDEKFHCTDAELFFNVLLGGDGLGS
jgi:hypothetical protein